jgi:hypothetical protein
LTGPGRFESEEVVRACFKSLLALAVLGLLGSGCSETFKLIWRSRVSKPQKQFRPAPIYRLSVVDWPSGANPRITVEVQQQKFAFEVASRIKKQFKKYENGKVEPVPNSEKTQKMSRITGETQWVPAPGMNVTFRVGEGGAGTPVKTDEEGKAYFDVSPFAEEWIEGRDLVVEVNAKLTVLSDPDPFTKVKGKPFSALKAFKKEPKEFSESVSVSGRTLQTIFDKR